MALELMEGGVSVCVCVCARVCWEKKELGLGDEPSSFTSSGFETNRGYVKGI